MQTVGSPRVAAATAGRENGPVRTAFLVLDTESVPDGKLLAAVKYAGEALTPEEAIARAQAEARETSRNGSDFLPVTFQVPVAVCVARVGSDFSLQAVTQLDAPQFRPREMTRLFWEGYQRLRQNDPNPVRLVTFNGFGFDLPLLELAAYRFGFSFKHYHLDRNRYSSTMIDLFDWFSNRRAVPLVGGMDVLAKMIGLPGKMGINGSQVYELYRQGRLQDINDYCLCDTLDTYFIFLRRCVLTGDITLEEERQLTEQARRYLQEQQDRFPVLRRYLAAWSGLRCGDEL